MATEKQAKKTGSVVFQCEYGRFHPRYWWLLGLVGVIGIVGVPIGLFWNKGWVMGGRPLEPWAATLIIEVFAGGALLVFVYVALAQWRRGKSPQRVAVTRSSLIIPKGAFSSEELVLPFSEIETTVFNAGFVRQLQIKHGRRKRLLVSSMFPSDEDFDRLVDGLPR